MPQMSSFRLWMFGFAIVATIGTLALGIAQWVYEGHVGTVFWLLCMTTQGLWTGTFAAIIRDRIDSRADRCALVSERLDEIETELASLDGRPVVVRQINGRRLYPVE